MNIAAGAERKKMSKSKCRKCKYHGVNNAFGGVYCNYLMLKKEMRKSDPDNCKEYEKGKRIRDKADY